MKVWGGLVLKAFLESTPLPNALNWLTHTSNRCSRLTSLCTKESTTSRPRLKMSLIDLVATVLLALTWCAAQKSLNMCTINRCFCAMLFDWSNPKLVSFSCHPLPRRQRAGSSIFSWEKKSLVYYLKERTSTKCL